MACTAAVNVAADQLPPVPVVAELAGRRRDSAVKSAKTLAGVIGPGKASAVGCRLGSTDGSCVGSAVGSWEGSAVGS